MSRATRILLLEPDHVLGEVYAKAFENSGCAVSWAKSAQQAIALADENTPTAVVMELHLPGHGGVEFLYEFRSYAEWQHVPVILHTLASEPIAAYPPELGVVKSLYKPGTTLRQLISNVHGVLPEQK